MNPAKKINISIEDYLNGELLSDIKHDYINGEVYAVSGASRTHNIISMNLAALLYNHLRATPCRVFGSDMKVGIFTANDDYFYYPDIQVSCHNSGHEQYNTEPLLIIEVLSPTTERKDRAEKFSNYRKLKSLQEYVLIAQDCQRVEIYRANNAWDLSLFGLDESIYFESIALTLNIAEIYQDSAIMS
ncbi:MAG: Uma2 family endonuclease [Methylococcaceae bacterium]